MGCGGEARGLASEICLLIRSLLCIHTYTPTLSLTLQGRPGPGVKSIAELNRPCLKVRQPWAHIPLQSLSGCVTSAHDTWFPEPPAPLCSPREQQLSPRIAVRI